MEGERKKGAGLGVGGDGPDIQRVRLGILVSTQEMLVD